jgi:hypothetical protein
MRPMNTTTNTNIITNELVVIDGLDVTDLVDVTNGHVICTCCNKTVEDNDDVSTYDNDVYDVIEVGHNDCLDDCYLNS